VRGSTGDCGNQPRCPAGNSLGSKFGLSLPTTDRSRSRGDFRQRLPHRPRPTTRGELSSPRHTNAITRGRESADVARVVSAQLSLRLRVPVRDEWCALGGPLRTSGGAGLCS
jgi:hypothetical protein